MRMILSGVNHDGNIQKMKILTLVSISNEQQEIEFTALAKQLSLNEDEVEEFIIDGESSCNWFPFSGLCF